MKKLITAIGILLLMTSTSFAEEAKTNEEANRFDAIFNIYQVIYTPSTSTWAAGGIADNEEIILTKKSIEGASTYSQLYYPDETLALTLSSDMEFVKNGRLIGVNNNELKFFEIIYNGNNFEEIPLQASEVQELFPEIHFIRLSTIDNDNKMWISKPLFKKKEFLFINDSEKSYYGLAPKMKILQKSELKGLITIPTYGFYTFTHLGQYKGKIRIYVRL